MGDSAVEFGNVDLSTCDREPIHIPGSIHPDGVLLVLHRATLEIEQAAGDTRGLLATAPIDLLGRSLDSLLADSDLRFLRNRLESPSEFLAPLIRLGVMPLQGGRSLDLTVHALDATAVIEFEAARGTIDRRDHPIAEVKVLLAALQHHASDDECFAAATRVLREVTGIDRAMVYRFLPDESGVVIAEDARPGLETFLGLHYPASDIPAQARELYRRNWLRAIPDVDYTPSPLIPAHNPRTLRPLDMSHCSLRSVSPIHLEYLRNMGVHASLSVSIVCNERLWGLLVLHHYAPHRVAADIRVACEIFAQVLSIQIEVRAQTNKSAQQLNARRIRELLFTSSSPAADLGDLLVAWPLQKYVGATGAAVFVDGRLRLVGVTPPAAAVLALVDWLNTLECGLLACDQLSLRYPPAEHYAQQASGLLAIGISRESHDYVLWFRTEFSQTVRWAGNPHKSYDIGPHGARLTPRGSFSEWLEVTRHRAVPWSEVEQDAADALRVLLLETTLKRLESARREQAFAAAQSAAQELERRVAERTAELRRVAFALEAAENRERRQIARDLHDDLGQTLAAARIRLAPLCSDSREGVADVAGTVGTLIDMANDSIRSLAAQLSPAVLYELGLEPALEWLGEEMQRTFNLRVTVSDDGAAKPLSQESRSILYRAVRELLINVAKHAKTDAASVESLREEGTIVIRVSDRGTGYDPESLAVARGRGFGQLALRERVTFIGGTVELESAPGRGTHALLRAPLAVHGA
jgi:light-regulated signal transduction histidine kinase (bacteriophytochrome)